MDNLILDVANTYYVMKKIHDWLQYHISFITMSIIIIITVSIIIIITTSIIIIITMSIIILNHHNVHYYNEQTNRSSSSYLTILSRHSNQKSVFTKLSWIKYSCFLEHQESTYIYTSRIPNVQVIQLTHSSVSFLMANYPVISVKHHTTTSIIIDTEIIHKCNSNWLPLPCYKYIVHVLMSMSLKFMYTCGRSIEK